VFVIFKKIFRIFSIASIAGLVAAVVMAAPVSAAFTTTFSPIFATSGAPGQLITFTGTASPAPSTNAAGLVYWDSTTTQVGTLTVASGATTIGGNFLVPANATLGLHTITISFSLTESYGPYAFNVIPTLTIATNAGFVGDQVQVTGTGYAASSSIQLYWDAAAFATVSSTATGTIGPVNVTVPDTSRGAHIISNTPTGSGAAAIYTVTSKLTASLTTVQNGDTLSVTGTGFAAGPNNVISLTIDGVPMLSTTPSPINTTTAGHFVATFTVPSIPYGTHIITAQDTASAQVTFVVTPKISLSSSSGASLTSSTVGDIVVIRGSGFAASETITYKIGTNTLAVVPQIPSNSSGVLADATFTVPALAAGTYTITVSDAEQHSASATITISANIAITPPGGPAGTQIVITGSGYAPGAPVSILWDNAALTPAVNTTASATGTINVTISAPSSARGPHTIKASDTSGSNASTSFTISSKIVLSPTTGGYGDTVTVTFSGFSASSPITGVKIVSGATTYDLATIPATSQTDANGSATLKFTIPGVPNGTWVIQGIDAGGSAQANLAVTQKIVLNPTTGSAGDTVGLVGTGFKASTGIDLKYAGATITVAAGITTDANGSFQTQFVIPKTVAGVMPVIAGDGTNSATASFTATAKATVSTVTNQTTPGFVGQDMTVTGTGFAPNGVITVTFESAPVTVAIVNADSAGSFTATFKVPTAPSGPHTIHVSDGTTTKDFPFFMDSTPPAAPKLVLPADKFKPKQPITFTWTVITDPSGVTYTLQISQDPSFATVPLEKTGLTTAQYLMTTAEKLKSAGSKTPYYWRVKATDLAGNVSPWSTANTFTIGFMWPSWIIYVWSGLAIIVALLLGLWIGRRMAFQSY
jgi:hypothetical protein